MDNIPVRRKTSDNIQQLDLQVAGAPIIEVGQGMPRAKRMDPSKSQEFPEIELWEREEEGIVVGKRYDVLTDKSWELANAFRLWRRVYAEAPISSFGIGLFDDSTNCALMEPSIWVRLRKTGFFSLIKYNDSISPHRSTIGIPFEIVGNSKILCSSGMLDEHVILGSTFSNIKKIIRLINEHQKSFLWALEKGFLKILELEINKRGKVLCLTENPKVESLNKEVVWLIDIFSKRCGFIEDCLSKMTPTMLNSYLIYEIILDQYVTVNNLYVNKFSKIDIIFPQFVEIVVTELSYIHHILGILRPYAANAYEDLGYDREDFLCSDVKIKAIYNAFNLGVISSEVNEGVGQGTKATLGSSHPNPNTRNTQRGTRRTGRGGRRNETANRGEHQQQQPKKLEGRKVEKELPVLKDEAPLVPKKAEVPSTVEVLLPKPRIEGVETRDQQDLKQADQKPQKLGNTEKVIRPKEPKRKEEWDKVKKQQELERVQRKDERAKQLVSDHQEVVKETEQKKLTERLALTKVFYQLPSRKQFKYIYGQLSNDHKTTFDNLYTAEAYSITPDKIEQLAERVAEGMLAIGIDPSTVNAFLMEVKNRNHPNHPEKKLPEGYIKKRCTSFIIFGFYPIGWEYSSYDEYKAFETFQQRKIDWKFSRISQF